MKSTVLRKKKIWEGFYLTILKVNKSTKNRIEVFTIRFNPKSIAIFSSNLLTRPHASSESMDSFSLGFVAHKHPHF